MCAKLASFFVFGFDVAVVAVIVVVHGFVALLVSFMILLVIALVLVVVHSDPQMSCQNCVYMQTAQSSYQDCSNNSHIPGLLDTRNRRTQSKATG